MDEAGGLSGLDRLAEVAEGLEDAGARREDVGGGARDPGDAAVTGTWRCAGRFEHAEIGEHVPAPALADAQAVAADPAATGELGADHSQAGAHRRGGRGAGVAEIVDHHGERRVESAHRGDDPSDLCRIGGRLDDRARQDLQRRAPRVQVHERGRQREQDGVDVVGDLLGGAALRGAWEDAVGILAADRREALSGERGRRVERRQDDQPALQCGRIELADQAAERDRALVLVAMVAPGQQHRRPGAAVQHRDRDRDRAPGVAVRRVWQIELTSRPGGRPCRTRSRCGSCSPSAPPRRAGSAAAGEAPAGQRRMVLSARRRARCRNPWPAASARCRCP